MTDATESYSSIVSNDSQLFAPWLLVNDDSFELVLNLCGSQF